MSRVRTPDIVSRVTLVSQSTQQCLGIAGAEASGAPLMIRDCDPEYPESDIEWFITGNGRIVHRDSNNGWFCMDLPDNDHTDGRQMQVYGCDWPSEAVQQYYEVRHGYIMLNDYQMCVGIDKASHYCDPENDEQRWDAHDLPLNLGDALATPSPLASSAAAPKLADSASAEKLQGSLRGLADRSQTARQPR